MQTIISYLIKLEANNNREWFNDNKELYQEAKSIFSSYVSQLIQQVGKFDSSVLNCKPEDCIFRIYRDTRFSNDKTPYKTHFGAYMAPGGRKSTKAGYYIHIQPHNETFAGGGVYMPQPDQLKAIRQEIYYNYPEFCSIIENPDFVKCFKSISDFGRLKKAPTGFSADWEGIEILKNKSFVVGRNFKDDTLKQKDILDEIVRSFQIMSGFNAFLQRADH